MSKRGRPKLTQAAAAAEAARVINVAHAWRYRPTALAALGFASKPEAWKYVTKRRRGLIGALIGDSVRSMLLPTSTRVQLEAGACKGAEAVASKRIRLSFTAETKIQFAASLVLDDGMPLYRAAKLAGTDLANLKRAIKQRQKSQARPSTLLSVRVEDISAS
jgi:hypothetical protein